jgi:DNA-binding SARP family transcriptional activator
MLGHLWSREGEPVQAIGLFEKILRLDNLREDVYVQLMRMCSLKGDRDGVARWFRRCRETLANELGVSPLPATLQLYQTLTKRK